MNMRKSKRWLYQSTSTEESNNIELPQKIDDMSISIMTFASNRACTVCASAKHYSNKICLLHSPWVLSNSLANHNMSTKQPCLFIIRHQQRGGGRNGHRGQQLVQTCFRCRRNSCKQQSTKEIWLGEIQNEFSLFRSVQCGETSHFEESS